MYKRQIRYGGPIGPCEADDRAAARVLVALADAAGEAGADRPRFVATALRELDRRLGGDAAVTMTRALESPPS